MWENDVWLTNPSLALGCRFLMYIYHASISEITTCILHPGKKKKNLDHSSQGKGERHLLFVPVMVLPFPKFQIYILWSHLFSQFLVYKFLLSLTVLFDVHFYNVMMRHFISCLFILWKEKVNCLFLWWETMQIYELDISTG